MSEFKENEFNTANDGGTPPVNENVNPGTADTPKVDGEYHFKNEFNDTVYTDAHYVPASENTVPPRYYTPPQKPVKEPKPKNNL